MQRGVQRTLSRISAFFDRGNILRFVVALLLAFAFWAWVEAANDPETTRVIGSVPVVAVNPPEGLEMVGQLPTVEVTVQGPQSKVSALDTDAVQARVDLNGIEEPGVHVLEVDVDVPDGVRVRSVNAPEVSVQLDVYETRTDIPVRTATPGDIPRNYEVRSIEVRPETVSIHGPRQLVERVAAVQVEVTSDGRSGRFTDLVVPEPVDADGVPVRGVVVDPAQITVAVELEARGQVRKVIPRVVGHDALAPGYELARPPSAVPTDEVIIEGPAEEVAKVFFLETEEIDITGWDQSQIIPDVPIDTSGLPPNVTVSTETVHVSIQIRRQAFQRDLSGVPVQALNLRDGTSATVDPSTVRLTLEGPRPVVEGLAIDDISIVVDVDQSPPGTYQMSPRVILPAGVQYRRVAPDTVTVTVVTARPTSTEAHAVGE